MTTTDLHDRHRHVHRAPRPAQPTAAVYRRRRRVAAAVAALAVTGLGAVTTGAVGGTAAVVASDSALGPQPFSVVAQPGDTLWALAHRYRGEVDHDRFLEALMALNGSPSVRVGQTVLIP